MDKLLLLPVSCMYKIWEKEKYVVFPEAVLQETISALQRSPDVEQGGIWGCSMKEPSYIVRFQHDVRGQGNGCSYAPCTEDLDNTLEIWHRDNVAFSGMVHTHPKGNVGLSPGDLRYVYKIFQANPALDRLLMAVLADSRLVIYGFQRDFLTWWDNVEDNRTPSGRIPPLT